MKGTVTMHQVAGKQYKVWSDFMARATFAEDENGTVKKLCGSGYIHNDLTGADIVPGQTVEDVKASNALMLQLCEKAKEKRVPVTGFYWDSSNVTAEIAAVDNVIAQYAGSIGIGQNKKYDEFIAALKDAGVEKSAVDTSIVELDADEDEPSFTQKIPATAETLKVNARVFVAHIGQEGVVQTVRPQKGEAEILCGNMRIRSKISDLFVVNAPSNAQTVRKKDKWAKPSTKNTENIQISKSLVAKPLPTLELNIIGKTVHEALPDVEAFIDSAVISNLEEVRIVHGVGTGKLRAGVHEFLRTHRNVAEYRLGKYGEGETGVTIVKIK